MWIQAAILAARLLGSLSISVVDRSDTALQGATVELLESGVVKQVATTDGAGQSLIAFAPPGSYKLRVRLDGFEPNEMQIQVQEGSQLKERVRLETGKVRYTICDLGLVPVPTSCLWPAYVDPPPYAPGKAP
jgi:hypothetical protein